MRKLLPHALLGQLVETVILLPELLLNGHGGGVRAELDFLEIHGVEDAHGALEALISLEVCELAGLSQDEQAEGGVVHAADEASEVAGILLGDDTGLDLLSETELEGVLTVVLPHTLEVGLIRETSRLLVRHDHILLLDDLGGELTKGLILTLEGFLALRGACVHAEHDVAVLVGVRE